jgi:hypothetical protein
MNFRAPFSALKSALAREGWVKPQPTFTSLNVMAGIEGHGAAGRHTAEKWASDDYAWKVKATEAWRASRKLGRTSGPAWSTLSQRAALVSNEGRKYLVWGSNPNKRQVGVSLEGTKIRLHLGAYDKIYVRVRSIFSPVLSYF